MKFIPYLLAAACFVGILLTTNVVGQEVPQWVPYDQVRTSLAENFKEIPIVMGVAFNGNIIEWYSDGNNWTIVETTPAWMSRFLGTGKGFTVIPPEILGDDS